jgi:hypothetical protein
MRHSRWRCVPIGVLLGSALGCTTRTAPAPAPRDAGTKAPAHAATPTPLAPGDVVAYLPHLRPSTVTAVLESGSFLEPSAVGDACVLLADKGYPAMAQPRVAELGDLVRRAYSAMPASQLAVVQSHLASVRGHRDSPAEEAAQAHRSFGRAIEALPADARGRLQELYSDAVELGLQERQAATERARLEAANPIDQGPVPPAARPAGDGARVIAVPAASPSAAPSAVTVMAETVSPPRNGAQGAARRYTADPESAMSSTDRGEVYWRDRMAAARKRVTAAESALRFAETALQVASSSSSSSSNPNFEEPCGATYQPLRGVVEMAEEAKANCARARATPPGGYPPRDTASQARQKLERAKTELQDARTALEDLQEEARRAGALPGWLR